MSRSGISGVYGALNFTKECQVVQPRGYTVLHSQQQYGRVSVTLLPPSVFGYVCFYLSYSDRCVVLSHVIFICSFLMSIVEHPFMRLHGISLHW